MTVSIVIPVLDDGRRLRDLLAGLQTGRQSRGDAGSGAQGPSGARTEPEFDIVVVDGGSRDDSVAVARAAGVRVLQCSRGRGQQLDAGARVASGSWLWFLHADSGISPAVLSEVAMLSDREPCWGRFDVRLAETPWLRLIAAAMNRRSAITGICTGDQGIFVHRALLDAVGGVPRQRLMEDIELSRRLRRIGRPLRIRTPIRASARRWQKNGVLQTMLLMWWLRFRYFCGADVDVLDRRYRG